jgi:hypothetical protein
VHIHAHLEGEAVELVFRAIDGQGEAGAGVLARIFRTD